MALMPINDSMFLDAEAREQPMHVGSLQLLVPPADAGPDFVAQLYSDTVATERVDRRLLRKPSRTAGGVGPWAWEREDHPDLEYHVRHSAVPHPGRVRELLALVSRLHGTLLDRSRPLWEAHLIEGLADGRFAIYTKMHHALIDGVSGMRILRDGLSEDPDERGMLPLLADRRPPGPSQESPVGAVRGATRTPLARVGEAISDAVGAVGEMVEAFEEVRRAVIDSGDAALRTLYRSFREEAVAVPYKAPRSMLNVPITGSRRFAADDYSLERIAEVRARTGGTLNDVVMAMCAGALRRYLLDHSALPDDPLIAMVPVALRSAAEAGEGGNAVGLVLCNLGTHLANPADRYALVTESMRRGKLRLEGLTPSGIVLLSAMAIAPLALGPLYRFEPMRKPPFNLVISNVPGPPDPLYHNGARLDGLYPLSIPTNGLAMNITVTTYAGSLEVGITGCRRSLPSLQRLLDNLESSLTELEKL